MTLTKQALGEALTDIDVNVPGVPSISGEGVLAIYVAARFVERLLPEKWCVQHDKPLVAFGTCALTELDGKPCRFEDRWDEGLVEVVAATLADNLNGFIDRKARAVLDALAEEVGK